METFYFASYAFSGMSFVNGVLVKDISRLLDFGDFFSAVNEWNLENSYVPVKKWAM